MHSMQEALVNALELKKNPYAQWFSSLWKQRAEKRNEMLNYRTWKELEKLSAFTELFFLM